MLQLIVGLLQNGEIGKNFNFFDSERGEQAPSSKIEIFCHFATVPLFNHW
jgi:hypothetical protein